MKLKTLLTYAASAFALAFAFITQGGTVNAQPAPTPPLKPQPSRAQYELLVFTWREPGICPPCDRARPILRTLEREYPIVRVYNEGENAQAQRALWRVDRYPTFILVARSAYGKPREVVRWSGADDLERRVRVAFAVVGVWSNPQPRTKGR